MAILVFVFRIFSEKEKKRKYIYARKRFAWCKFRRLVKKEEELYIYILESFLPVDSDSNRWKFGLSFFFVFCSVEREERRIEKHIYPIQRRPFKQDLLSVNLVKKRKRRKHLFRVICDSRQ